MKTFFRGIRRYLASAFLIIVLILVSNFVVLFYMMYSTTGGDGTSQYYASQYAGKRGTGHFFDRKWV